MMSRQARLVTYVLPVINPLTDNADQFAIVSRIAAHHKRVRASSAGRLAMDAAGDLLGEDWLTKIYADNLKVGNNAARLTGLVNTIEATLGSRAVRRTPPRAPALQKTQQSHFDATGLEVETVKLAVDYRMNEPHSVGETPVSSMKVDELSVPRFVYKAASSKRKTGTRVTGCTPVFIARKPA